MSECCVNCVYNRYLGGKFVCGNPDCKGYGRNTSYVVVCDEFLEKMSAVDLANIENAKYYGYEAQSNQLVEECAELIQAVNKYRRAVAGIGEPVSEDKKAIAFDNLVEEIADVEIMLEQIKYLLKIPEEDLLAYKQFKINRIKECIEGRG